MSNDMTEIPILYEDKDYVVINKPPGLMVHSDGRQPGPYLTDWILSKYPDAAGVGEPARDEKGNSIDRSGIVHRLDKETSGVLIIAKNNKAHSALKKQFQNRTVKKKYLAFVWGELKEEFGTIDRPIGRSGKDFRRWSAQRGTRGQTKEAETYWTKLSNGKWKPEGGREEKFTLVEAEPKTGRTHQIRVHFLAIQHPVVGDRLYAPKKPMVLGFDRTALHSKEIIFQNMDGKIVRVEAPLPADFEKASKEIES